MITVGVTGNIGSGKTTVCRIFESMNIPVVYADHLAKDLMIRRLSLRAFLLETFGRESYDPKGSLNTALLSKAIFEKPELRQSLEEKVHPAVQQYLKYWFDSQSTPYAIEEAALIYESGSDQWLDIVIFVDAPLETRMERVIKRDQTTPEAFLSRERAQLSPEEKIKKADFVINNSGSLSLIQQIASIHQQLLKH